MNPATAAAAAAAAATLACAGAFWSNRQLVGWLPDDPPHPARKRHRAPVPLAGVVLLPAVLPWLCAAAEWSLAAAAGIATAAGWLDDRSKARGGLDWRAKAALLLLAAAAVALAAVDPLAEPLRFAAVVGFVFVVTNATNFLDNTDGVAASLAAVSLLGASGGEGPLAAAGFAALGFLPWNWPRPRLFLGDAGAYLLGVLSAAAALRPTPFAQATLAAVAVQLADFVQVVCARLWLGLLPWVGDRRHLTHIAQNLGLPPVAVAPAFAALAAAIALWARR